ncbi:type II secretion system F family protein, partial [Yersinia similis]
PFLDRLVKKIEVNGLEAGLTNLQKELPSREVSMLCVTLQQSLRYGSSIYEYLMELSSEMRELQLLKTEEIIGKLSAKMSIPLVLFFMFPVVIIIAAPGVMRVMSQG